MMKSNEINIRDPFVVYEDGTYYLYGTRANNFGNLVGGVDVYTSNDLENWSNPIECFDSVKTGLNRGVNWAPEVHKYQDKYYMFISLTRENGLRGTFSLVSDSLLGPFLPHSADALTPEEWECIDGTLYINQKGEPYLVFCHEHTQIADGTMCYVPLTDDLKSAAGEAVTMFSASSYELSFGLDCMGTKHFVTDGPYMYRSKTCELFMLWSTFIDGKYAECLVKFNGGELGLDFEHKAPIIADDTGHGMIFTNGSHLYLTYHAPNFNGYEHPVFRELDDCGDTFKLL